MLTKRNILFAAIAVLGLSLIATPLIAFTLGTFEESDVVFDAPDELLPNTSYRFDFTVYNMASVAKDKRADWIEKVSLTLPTIDYVIDESEMIVPTPLHPETTDYWDVTFNPTNVSITWQIYGVNSDSPGDIREDEDLMFSFVATTDDSGTDGFFWRLFGDQGDIVDGVSNIGSSDDDDSTDDDAEDDDDDTSDDDFPGKDDEEEDTSEEDCCN